MNSAAERSRFLSREDKQILSELRKGNRCDAGVQKWFAATASEELFVSVLVLGEIRQGIERIRLRDEPQAQALEKWLDERGPAWCGAVEVCCADMWDAYHEAAAAKLKNARRVVDRFHIMSHMNKAIDKVRATEARTLKTQGKEPVLTGSRWCLLKRPENRTEKQTVKLNELLAINLKTVRAYLLKEDFQRFWGYKSAGWAARRSCVMWMISCCSPMTGANYMPGAGLPSSSWPVCA